MLLLSAVDRCRMFLFTYGFFLAFVSTQNDADQHDFQNSCDLYFVRRFTIVFDSTKKMSQLLASAGESYLSWTDFDSESFWLKTVTQQSTNEMKNIYLLGNWDRNWTTSILFAEMLPVKPEPAHKSLHLHSLSLILFYGAHRSMQQTNWLQNKYNRRLKTLT